jgi:hypothetical protein
VCGRADRALPAIVHARLADSQWHARLAGAGDRVDQVIGAPDAADVLLAGAAAAAGGG